jgi:predicted NAD/FAD-dependent oxidoreductase
VSGPTVAVVGAGIAGVACARALTAAGIGVEVHERGHAVGGRLASRRLDGRTVDIGASYCTASDAGFRAVVDDWLARGVARAWTDTFDVLQRDPDGTVTAGERRTGPVRYAGTAGQRGLVVDLAAGLDVRRESPVGVVAPGPVVDGRRYAAVVLAMPDPQALRLLDAALTDERAALGDRAWEPALVLTARYAGRPWAAGPRALRDGAFVHGDPVLAWVADDGARRGDGAPVLVAHSTPEFAAAHLADPAAATGSLVAALTGLLGLPVGPAAVAVHRWTYAKPVGTREGLFHLGGSRVGLAGDGWGASKVETAWLSGTRCGQALARTLG